MTFWDLLAIVWRRWYVTLAGVLITGLALLGLAQASPVYLSQVTVVLLPPVASGTNGLGTASGSLIDMAGVVARAMGGGDSQAVSDDVTLAGEGRRDGYLVRQPNDGGQWNYAFSEPQLSVQAVGATPAEAEATMNKALDTIDATLTRLQDAEGVRPANRIRTELVPSTPQLREVGGNSSRALAATVLAGGLGTLLVLGALGPTRRRGEQTAAKQTVEDAQHVRL